MVIFHSYVKLPEGICWLLFIVVACFHGLWLFLCLQLHVTWLNGSICAVLLPTRKQGCSEVCHNLFANILASLVLRVNIYWDQCMLVLHGIAHKLLPQLQTHFKHIFRQAEPHAFNVPCEPMGSHPTRGSAGFCMAAGHRKSMGFALGVWLNSPFCRCRIPILQDSQDDSSDSSGWLRCIHSGRCDIWVSTAHCGSVAFELRKTVFRKYNYV